MEIDIAGNLVRVQFSSNVMPVFLEKRNSDFVYFGEDNNYPAFLIDLQRKHPEHGAILKAKSKYIYGKGLTVKQDGTSTIELAKAQAFLARANRFEDWNSVFEKTVKSNESFNGFCWQIIWDIFGRKAEVYFLQFAKCRRSADMKTVMYCNKWVDDQGRPLTKTQLLKYGYQEFPAFDPNVRKGTQILYYAVTEQSADELSVYPFPEYAQALINIDMDVAISVFKHSLVANGMSAQGMLSLFNGTPTEDEKRKIKKMFESKYTGPGKAGQIIFNFVDQGTDAKGAEWTTFTVSDMDKSFESMSKENQQKIVTGHQIPNKSLVGISVEGALSDRTAIIESFEQLTNTYTEPRQNLILDEIKMIGSLHGVNLPLEVIKLAPLGVDITDPNLQKYFDEDEIREKLGYKPRENKPAQPGAEMPQVNENLKNLTGRQWISIKRLIREVGNGKTSRQAASMILKTGYGLGDEDIKVLLPEAEGLFSSVLEFADHFSNEKVLALFEALAVDEATSDTFISEELATFANPGKRDTVNNILDLIKGDPTITEEKIQKILGIEADYVKEVMDDLLDRGLISKSGGKIIPSDKGIDRTTPPVETEIYTVYKYATRDDVPEAKESRPFCSRLLQLSREGKRWTREAIDKISNELGENAWSYRGGFYTNPDTGETTTHCRHVWKAVTRSRTKK